MAQKITLDLSVFKSSGVYTLEFNASDNIILNPQTVRLVVGYSNKGPFNTAVYLPDPQTALTVFGDIDRSLEKKGSFFHRSIFTCLNSGPIFAVNLLRLNDATTELGTPDVENGADVSRYRAFSVDTAEVNGNNPTTDYATVNTSVPKQDKLLSSYYNKQKFWFADPNALLATMDTSNGDSTKLFSFVNLSQNPVSIIIKKSLDSRIPIRGFDISAQEYYGANNVPSYIHPYDYISDYFLDVIVISGNWTDYQNLSLDPLYSSYFTPKGFIKSQIDAFLALTSVNVVLSVTGCFIPDFVDQNGINQDIKVLINNQVGQTGILCAVNDQALDDLETGNFSLIDLVGHHLINQLDNSNPTVSNPNIDFLSYSSPLFSDLVYNRSVNSLYDAVSPGSTLVEAGTLFEYLSQTGLATADFATYSSSALDAGLPYLQTNVSGGGAAAELAALQDFLTASPTIPGPRYILGQAGDLTGNTLALASFNSYDLVKLKVESVSTVSVMGNPQLRIRWSHPLFSAATPLVAPYADTNINSDRYQFGQSDYFNKINPSMGLYEYVGYESAQLYIDAQAGNVTNGDVVYLDWLGSSKQYIGLVTSVDRDAFKTITMTGYSDAALTSLAVIPDFGSTFTTLATGPGNTVGTTQIAVISLVGNLSQEIGILSTISSNQVELDSTVAANSGIAVGDLLVSTDMDLFLDENRLTRIIEVKRVPIIGFPGTYTIYVKTDRPIYLFPGSPLMIKQFQAIEQFIQNYKFTYLPGFKLKAYHKPDGSDQQVDNILDVLFNTNIATSLADPNIITFRYVVDTFDGQIKTNSKYQLALLAKQRQKCLALINAPSIKKFMESTDPRFTDATTATNPAPLFDARYVASGGNLSLNPSFTFTLPDEDNGAKFAGTFSPFLTIRENNKNINIPPAAHVSNNFIRKFVTGEPYAIVAGQKRGIISGSNVVGVEYDFSTSDRDYLEPFGINPIIRKRNIGIVIYGNQTNYQRTSTAFNNLHVRDLLITLEDSIETILGNYVFDFNEDSVRLEIKTLVDNFLSGVKNVGGIYNYLTIMDSSNNTPGIIDQNLGIIDVIVEPARGIHKFINRLTVAKTGGINSGGFIQFG